MTFIKFENHDGYLAIDRKHSSQRSDELNAAYVSAQPFPHIVIDDFIDIAVLRKVVKEFPSREGKTYFDRDQERLKYQFTPSMIESGLSKNLLAELNSAAMLEILSKITGIRKLVPDPHYLGGGLHETLRGGHLSIHADFNLNDQLNAVRRLNLLIYLNEDWDESFGGELELWDKQMTQPIHRIKPTIGRAVLFNTDLDAFHGQPSPLTCPIDRSRKSIALYYYTFPESGLMDLRRRTTTFKTRPQSNDRKDWKISIAHLINDWVPPRLQSKARRLFDKLS
jgi:Rps23 Pro-64 3,4-dihydroxylase Tpa1-like proline 4-hydroxylase